LKLPWSCPGAVLKLPWSCLDGALNTLTWARLSQQHVLLTCAGLLWLRSLQADTPAPAACLARAPGRTAQMPGRRLTAAAALHLCWLPWRQGPVEAREAADGSVQSVQLLCTLGYVTAPHVSASYSAAFPHSQPHMPEFREIMHTEPASPGASGLVPTVWQTRHTC
jgi:hypothetical protein